MLSRLLFFCIVFFSCLWNKVINDFVINKVQSINKSSIYDSINEDYILCDNLIDDEFIKDLNFWEVSGINTPLKEALQVEKSNISKILRFERDNTYLVVCYAKIEQIASNRPGAYYARNGIGIRIKDAVLPSYGAPIVDVDFCGMMQKTDYVPILKLIDVKTTVDVRVSFGCIYPNLGDCVGKIAHVGVYNVTSKLYKKSYKDLFYRYKKHIENTLHITDYNNEVIYPDSDARDIFVKEMNDRAKWYGMSNSLFYTPSGLTPYRDGYNETRSYVTKIVPKTRHIGKIIIQDTYKNNKITIKNQANASYTEFCNLDSDNIYVISNIKDLLPNRLAHVFYFDSNEYIGYDYGYLNGATSFIRDATKTNKSDKNIFCGERLLKIPYGCNQIKVNSGNNDDEIPTLLCYSTYPIDKTSVELNSKSDITRLRRLSNRSTAKDLCILYSIASKHKKLQEVWNMPFIASTIDGINKRTVYKRGPSINVNSSSLRNNYYYIGGKGGSWDTKNILTYGLVLRNRETNKTYAMVCAHSSEGRTEQTIDIFQKLLNRYIESEENPKDIYFDTSSTEWDYAAICEVQVDNPFAWRDYDANINSSVYTPINYYGKVIGKNINEMFNPMSMSKVMTAIIALDYLDLHENIEIVSTDLVAGSGLPDLREGDILNVRDAVHLMLSVSDNSIATAFSRIVGQKMLIKSNY